MTKREEYIEVEIFGFLKENGVQALWKNDIKGYYNEKTGQYQKNKSNFITRGISDISFVHKGQFVCIEVKRPSEMSSFDRSLDELNQDFALACARGKNEKKRKHAVEQKQYIESVKKGGGIGFFASSVEEVKERLELYNFKF